MLRKFGILLFFAITLAGSSGLRAEEDMMWKLYRETLAVAFHPNSQILAVGTHLEGVFLYDVLTGNPIDTIPNLAHKGRVVSLAFNSTGTKLAVATIDYFETPYFSQLSVWDMETKQETVVERIDKESGIPKVLFTPNDSFLIYSYGINYDHSGINGMYKAKASDLSQKTQLPNLGFSKDFSISRDGKYLVLTDFDNVDPYEFSNFNFYDLENNCLVSNKRNNYSYAKFSPAKDELFILKWNKNSYEWYEDYIEVLDPNNNFQVLRSISLPNQYQGYDISSDGNYIVFGGQDLYILNISDGSVKYKYNLLESQTDMVHISPNMEYIEARTIAMFIARFGNSIIEENQVTNYFAFNQDINNTYLKITKLDNNLNISNIKIYDTNANLIQYVNEEAILNNSIITINTQNLLSGAYYLNISSNDTVYTHSFVIVR